MNSPDNLPDIQRRSITFLLKIILEEERERATQGAHASSIYGAGISLTSKPDKDTTTKKKATGQYP